MIAEEKRSELEKLDAIRRTFLEAWPKLSGRAREAPTVRLQVIKGRAQIYRTLRQFVSTAKGEVLAFTTTKGLQRSYRAGINEALLAAMRRGVKARLAADIAETNGAPVARVSEHVRLRHVDRHRAARIIVARGTLLRALR